LISGALGINFGDHAKGVGGVSTEMLIGEEENFYCFVFGEWLITTIERPVENGFGI